ncbi:MAG: Enoyl-CoA hydratase/isomerase [Tardiphaga sp.]|nr:Enoyl-CoA hydratase/isomerase [Tardiphaga sp.]
MTYSSDQDQDLIVTRDKFAGVIRLNRPKAINALTLEMTRTIAEAMDDFETNDAATLVLLEGAGERGLCAGGDIRGLYDSARVHGDLGPVFWREEYRLNARIAAYDKPYVAYMDGIVMGGGVGLAAHGRHRVVNEKTKLAMPEVGIGFFPDVGGTWLLARAPGETGTYFGLTGQTMNGADAMAAGFADVFIAAKDWPAARAALTELDVSRGDDDVQAVLKQFSSPPGDAPVSEQRAQIDRLFAFETMTEIVDALENDSSDFARATLDALRTKSPTSMVVTLKLLRQARASSSLEECLSREYIAALQVFVSDDFLEGVRAAIIDKDRNPKWKPADLAGVTPEIVARYFDAEGREPLVFPGS